MPEFSVRVRKEVPAYGEITVEAETLEAACIRVRDEIGSDGDNSPAGEAEFVADWSESHDLRVADVVLPDGRNFTAHS